MNKLCFLSFCSHGIIQKIFVCQSDTFVQIDFRFPFADKLYVTWVYKDFDGDTFFPEIDEQEWEVLEQSPRFYDEASMLNYAYFTYKRK